MDSTMAMILFEWKRIRWSLLAACGILVLLFAAAGLWPGEKSMRLVGIVIVAVPALLVPALFGSLAADRGEWPFLLGLPYPASKLFLLRLLLRVLILLPAVSLFSLTGVLLLEEGITMAFLQVLPIVLLENLAIAAFFVFLAPVQNGLGLLMGAIIGMLVLVPAQLPAIAAVESFGSNEFRVLAYPAVQLTVLLAAGGYVLWRKRVLNRPVRRALIFWSLAIVLVPWIEWGGAWLAGSVSLAVAKQEAREAGIILVEPKRLFREFDSFTRADLDDYLAQFGYSPDEEPFYCVPVENRRTRKQISKFVTGAVTEQLQRDYRANDIENLRRDVNAGVFCGYVALGRILYDGGSLEKYGKTLEALIGQLERAQKYDFSHRYAVSIRDAWQEVRPLFGKRDSFLMAPGRKGAEARFLRRETAAFRDIARIRAMNGDELAAHLRRPARLEASRLYGLVLREREVRKWFKLYAEALKLKLELYRTGALPETLDTGLPFRYERTRNGFRFVGKKGMTVLSYPAPERAGSVKGR